MWQSNPSDYQLALEASVHYISTTCFYDVIVVHLLATRRLYIATLENTAALTYLTVIYQRYFITIAQSNIKTLSNKGHWSFDYPVLGMF